MACSATIPKIMMIALVIVHLPTISATPLEATGQIYYVKPNESYNCTHMIDEPCHTLAYYAANVTTYFTSNTTMIFLPGNHSLTNRTVQIGNITDLALIGNDNFFPGPRDLPPESSSRVKCSGSVVFSFENITGLVIQNLVFLSCSGEIRVSFHSPRPTALLLYEIFNLTMSGVTIRNSNGYGLHGSNILGKSEISGCTFAFNIGSNSYYGGNMKLYFQNCLQTAVVYIGHSHFLYGNNPRNYSQSSGLSILIQCTNVEVTIDNVTMIGNEGESGGNFAISFNNKTDIFKIPVLVQNCHINGGIARVGAGMHISLLQNPPQDHSNCSYGKFLHICNTTFANNHAISNGGGIFMSHDNQQVFCNSPGELLVVEKCTFYNNSKGNKSYIGGVAVYASNLYIPTYLPHGRPQLQWSFINCNFSQNSDAHYYESSATVYTTEETVVLIINSTFQNNNCTAITAVNSNIIFGGNVTITDNIGNNGGGLVLCDDSFMYLQPHTTVLFSGNHARHTGGAIYTEDSCLESKSGCFFQLAAQLPSQPEPLNSIHVVLENNSAMIAGSAIYGGSIDYCYLISKGTEKSPREVFDQIFYPNYSPSDMSFITSGPIGVCFCNHNMTWHYCSDKDHHVVVYPGETFNISVVVVGQRDGTVPGEVFASFLENARGTSLMNYEYVHAIKCTNCSFINYTVFSMRHKETLVLRAQSTENYYPSPVVTVELKSCPLGFTLAPSPYRCDCVYVLAELNITCDINIPGIERQAPAWIGYDHSNSEILFCLHCPFDYCKPQDVVITTTNTSFNQNEQCAFSRKGILCGECKEKLSLALGSSQCLSCSNIHLLLLIAFAVAGVMLVVLIAVCNLTVTEGTINGLIFYANIIQINSATFFPPLTHKSSITTIAHVLTVFISWINLDLGIQTCFYDGMDTYTKTWLQFAFPIYIWVIAGVIIILSRKFTIFARIVGRNGVQLLATLFLLSYAKLQRTIIAALSYSFIEHSNSSESVVWLYDGNVRYLQRKHIPLFVVAVLFGLISLPYMFILLFLQCLQKKSDMKLLFWINRLKPLFDAYTGPYKDKYRFWTGFLLFIRAIFFAFNILYDPQANLTVTACSCYLLLMLSWRGGTYRKWPLDALESSFFLNLGILCIATVYINYQPGNQVAVTCTSLGTAFVTFLGILLYHTYTKTKSSYPWRRFSIWLSRRRNTQAVLDPVLAERDSPVEENEPVLVHTPRVVHVRDQYREPLLASN